MTGRFFSALAFRGLAFRGLTFRGLTFLGLTFLGLTFLGKSLRRLWFVWGQSAGQIMGGQSVWGQSAGQPLGGQPARRSSVPPLSRPRSALPLGAGLMAALALAPLLTASEALAFKPPKPVLVTTPATGTTATGTTEATETTGDVIAAPDPLAGIDPGPLVTLDRDDLVILALWEELVRLHCVTGDILDPAPSDPANPDPANPDAATSDPATPDPASRTLEIGRLRAELKIGLAHYAYDHPNALPLRGISVESLIPLRPLAETQGCRIGEPYPPKRPPISDPPRINCNDPKTATEVAICAG